MEKHEKTENKIVENRLIRTPFVLTTTREELEIYSSKFNCYHSLSPEDRTNLIDQLEIIITSYNHQKNFGGGFLTAVMTQNWHKASYKADLTNKSCLEIYKDFMTHKMPKNCQEIFGEFQ